MKQYKHYFLAYAVFLGCLFTAPHIYAFFDFHVANPYEHYDHEKRDWERQNPGEHSFMSYNDWLEHDNTRAFELLDYIADEFAQCVDPWYEPQVYHNERG